MKDDIKTVDVAIIGAGTAGLSAMREVLRETKSFLLIDRGPLGTTCSRVGCMPSKLLLEIAAEYQSIQNLVEKKVWRGQGELDTAQVMTALREKRDYFVQFAVRDTEALGERYLKGNAKFIDAETLDVDGQKIKARRFIIATGTSPTVPDEWKKLGDVIITTDQIFELKDLPKAWAVVGLGPLGLELGQALSWLDRKVHGFDKAKSIGAIKDPVLQSKALECLREDMPMELGVDVKLKAEGSGVRVSYGSQSIIVDKVLAAMGRHPNLKELNIEAAGIKLDKDGHPDFDEGSMQIKGSRIFIAGDVDQKRAVLHEAADEGRIAGFNAARDQDECFDRRVPATMAFTSPQIAKIGQTIDQLENPVVGEACFDEQGRAVIKEENCGLIRLYADQKSGRLLGAELVCPGAEHFLHLLAFAVEHKHSVEDLLRIPFYHPTLEEGMRTALRDARGKLHAGEKNQLELKRKADKGTKG